LLSLSSNVLPDSVAKNTDRNVTSDTLWDDDDPLLSSSSSSVIPYLAQVQNVTLTWERNGTVSEWLDLERGAYVRTNTITVLGTDQQSYTFCVKVYPFGCSSSSSSGSSGFGMSYALTPQERPWPFQNNPMAKFDQNLMIFLQFIPQTIDQTADVSFRIRLCGQQALPARRLDIEWQAGMRLVHPTYGQLGQGQANDFGTSLMRSNLITSFWNHDDATNKSPIQIQLDLQIHQRPPVVTMYPSSSSSVQHSPFLTLPLPHWLQLRDIRQIHSSTITTQQQQQHDMEQVRVGRVVVPIITKLSQRQRMFQMGVYPGVEYRILRIHQPITQQQQLDSNEQNYTRNHPNVDLFYSRPGAYYDLKPMYPLVQQLERPWPVTVSEQDIPKLYTPNQYNAISAIGSLLTAFTGLLVAFFISQCISLYYIPSRSMDPTLKIGDVLLVEKVSPQIAKGLGNMGSRYHTGDIILFNPPIPLQDIVARSGSAIDRRALFVKRVAAEPGDRVVVHPTGTVQITTPNGAPRGTYRRDLCDEEPNRLIQKFLPNSLQETIVQPDTVAVLGDCASVSIDSRVWGSLPTQNIVGRPIVRLWPISKFGPVPALPSSAATMELNKPNTR
jgi:signal peptidase I